MWALFLECTSPCKGSRFRTELSSKCEGRIFAKERSNPSSLSEKVWINEFERKHLASLIVKQPFKRKPQKSKGIQQSVWKQACTSAALLCFLSQASSIKKNPSIWSHSLYTEPKIQSLLNSMKARAFHQNSQLSSFKICPIRSCKCEPS